MAYNFTLNLSIQRSYRDSCQKGAAFEYFILTRFSKFAFDLKRWRKSSRRQDRYIPYDHFNPDFGQSLIVPQANPSFKGGPGELKKYFSSHSLKDAKAKDIVFRVHIGFLVNCSGEAGNFQLISKGKGDLQLLADQVLTIVKEIPQNWQPALVDNKPVDCYQILSFTIVSGALDKVSYR